MSNDEKKPGEIGSRLPKVDRDMEDGAPDPRLKADYDPSDPRNAVRALVGKGAGIEQPGSIDHGTGLNRRRFLQAGAAAGAGAMLPWNRAFPQKPKDEVVRVGYIPITDAAALLIAYDQDFYKKQGLEAEKPELHRGWMPLIEAFQAHRHNLAHLLNPIPLWMRYSTGVPVKITAWDHTNGSACVFGSHTDIKGWEDFGGKQVAVPWWYSNHNIILQDFLREVGITPVIRPQDAKIGPDECNLQVVAPPDMPPALAARRLDAYIVAEPFNSLGEMQAGGEVIRFTGDYWKGHPCCVVVMHEDDVEDPDREEWTQAVTDAIVEAQLWIGQNREKAAERLSRDGGGYLPFPKDVIDRAMNFYDPAYYDNPQAIKHVDWEQDRINMQAWPYRGATEYVIERMREVVLTGEREFLNEHETEFILDDLVNYKFIKNSLEKHPEWKNDKSVPQEGDPYEREEVFKL